MKKYVLNEETLSKDEIEKKCIDILQNVPYITTMENNFTPLIENDHKFIYELLTKYYPHQTLKWLHDIQNIGVRYARNSLGFIVEDSTGRVREISWKKALKYVSSVNVEFNDVMLFGKYKGETLLQIKEVDPTYLDWLLSIPIEAHLYNEILRIR